MYVCVAVELVCDEGGITFLEDTITLVVTDATGSGGIVMLVCKIASTKHSVYQHYSHTEEKAFLYCIRLKTR